MECSAKKFFVCWMENFLRYSGDEDALAFAAWSFTQNSEMFQTMMADGFCKCDGKCK
jgi:hypothetical protein